MRLPSAKVWLALLVLGHLLDGVAATVCFWAGFTFAAVYALTTWMAFKALVKAALRKQVGGRG